jgi:hypothetical protein
MPFLLEATVATPLVKVTPPKTTLVPALLFTPGTLPPGLVSVAVPEAVKVRFFAV